MNELKKTYLGVLFILGLTLACVHQLVLDPSASALDSGDLTLALSACQGTPGGGLDICRVKEGSPISSVWRLVVPVENNVFLGGELTVYFKDQSRSYPINQPVIEIPWTNFFAPNTNWSRDMDGEALALAQIRWKNPQGIEETWRARGIAKIVVTKVGYDPLPIDSGFIAWKTACRIQYSTAGRSALECK